MNHTIWPDWIEETILAKSVDRSEGDEPESLARHTWCVLSRLTDFIRLRPNVPKQLNQPRLWHILYWATFVHDFGKVMPAFQGVLRGELAGKERWEKHRHEIFSLGFIDWIVEGLSIQEREWLMLSIISHHKDTNQIMEGYGLLPTGMLLAQFEGLENDNIIGLHRWLVECGWQWAIDLELEQAGVKPLKFVEQPVFPFAPHAVKQICAWLLSFYHIDEQLDNEDDTKQLVPLLTLRGTLINSDHAGSSHRGKLPSVEFSAEDVLGDDISWDDLYEHQTEAEQLIGSALLTAPTGSGKTEAALLWAAQQSSDLPAMPRIFYTLPYQASMNAMKLRLDKTFGEKMVALQHGRSALALYNLLIDRDYDPQKAAWHTRQIKDLTHLNYQPVRVFSPYQMLKWMYRLKGYETNLADYHNGLFIFDEIHAYEVKRLALILKSIEYLRCYYHARFFIMSATFPTIIKTWLKQTLDLGESENSDIIATSELFKDFQRHQLDVIDGDLLNHLDKARVDALAGKSVLVVCNLIARAQNAYEALQSLRGEGIKVILLHGNFNMRDRDRKEREIRRLTGAKSNERCPTVVIATQVVEVSLDIDLDTIYTDPAPLEALVQRFGRINRAMKLDIAPVHVFTTLQNDDDKPIHMIYDQRLLEGTLKVLYRENGKRIDESKIGGWLDEIYDGEVAEHWKQEFEEAAKNFEEAVLQTLRPFQSDQALKQQFYKAFDGIDVLPDCFWDKYEMLMDAKTPEARFEAHQLLVSISYPRLHQINSKRRKLTEEWPIVVDIPYSSDGGLDLSVLRE